MKERNETEKQHNKRDSARKRNNKDCQYCSGSALSLFCLWKDPSQDAFQKTDQIADQPDGMIKPSRISKQKIQTKCGSNCRNNE